MPKGNSSSLLGRHCACLFELGQDVFAPELLSLRFFPPTISIISSWSCYFSELIFYSFWQQKLSKAHAISAEVLHLAISSEKNYASQEERGGKENSTRSTWEQLEERYRRLESVGEDLEPLNLTMLSGWSRKRWQVDAVSSNHKMLSRKSCCTRTSSLIISRLIISEELSLRYDRA